MSPSRMTTLAGLGVGREWGGGGGGGDGGQGTFVVFFS